MVVGEPAVRFHGRTVERRALRDALDRVESGRAAIPVVEGEAGIGKTRLLGEALAEARARGMQVLSGRAERLERLRPFGVLVEALECRPSSPDPRRAAISALLAAPSVPSDEVTTVTSDPGLQFQVVDAVLDLVEALADGGPLVIGLDDLQWADPSTLLTVGALVRRLSQAPIA
jgi:predicted ATPase